MEGIKKYLEKYRKQLFGDDERKEAVISIIQTITRIKLDRSMIRIERGVLKIKTDHATKNELFLYKDRILEKLKEGQIPASEISYT